MQWLKPDDTVIRVINQLVKLLSIFVGTWVMLGRGGERGMLYGALLGLIYMALGVGLYALLSGQQLPLTAYLSDIAMGVAGRRHRRGDRRRHAQAVISQPTNIIHAQPARIA